MKTTTLLIVALLAVGGCTTNTERTDYKDQAAKGRPLDMPPDMVLPKTEGKYVVPDGGAETSATYSEYAKGGTIQGQACICKEAAASQPVAAQPKVPQPVAVIPPKLSDRPDGSKSILIAEPFDRCWLKVGQAVDQAALVVEDKDRSKGLLYLKGGNQLSIEAKAAEPGKAESCEVSAASTNGAVTPETRRVIEALYKSLSK